MHFPGSIQNPEDNGGRHLGWTPPILMDLGRLVRPYIARAFTIDEGSPLTEDDIDWVPTSYQPGTLVAIPCSLEIETFGFRERIEKLSEARVLKLKQDIVGLINSKLYVPADDRLHFPGVDPDKPLIWIKYLGPKGHHV